MPEYNAGDAKLRIIPDASAFKRELETKLDAIKVNYNVRVGVEMAQARADMVRFRSEEQSKAVGQRVAPQFSRANAEMAAWRAEQKANAVNVPVNADTSQARNAVKSLTSDASSGFSKLSGEVNKALGGLLSIGKTVGLTALVANIPAAVTGVVSLTQAIQQLSGAALVVPGAIATAGASIGTLAVGLSGVKDAYAAVSAASDASSTGQAAQAAAAASATNGLRNAVVDEAQAQKDVATARKDARQELQDLNLEMRGGVISEKQAINDAAKARRDLAKGGFKDALDQQDALLRVESADQRVAESHARTLEVAKKKNEADAKGVEGSDLVVAANERLTRSHQSVESAQASLAAAAVTASAASQKADAAMAKLAPNAREFVTTLRDLKPRWDDLKQTVQGNLFEGASTSFTQFVDNVLPNLKTGMSSIATAWNTNIKTMLKSLGSDNSKGLLDRILGNTAQAQNNFDKAIDPLVKGIGTLTAAGSDAIPRLATAIGSVAERFSNFITAADADGRLAAWIDKGLTGFTDLGNILLNIGKSFVSVNDALGGQGILGNLRQLTDRMATFLGSTEGQNKLKAFFQEGRDEIEKLKPIVSNIIQILPEVWRGAKDAWDTFRPGLELFTKLLTDAPGLVRLAADAFIAWKTIDGVTKLIGNLTTIDNLLGKGTKGGGGILGKVGLIAIGGVALDSVLGTSDSPTAPSTGDSLKNLTANVGGGAAAGAAAGGVPGAIAGAAAGAGSAIYDRAAGDFKRQGAEADRIAEENRQNRPYVPPTVGGPGVNQELRAKIAAGQVPGYSIAADGTIIGPDGKPVPNFSSGGSAGAGLAVLHPNEFVLSDRAKKYPMGFKHALNEGRIDPKSLPHYDKGGPHAPDPYTDAGLYPPISGPPGSGGVGDILGPVGPAPGGGGILSAAEKAIGGLGSMGIFAPGGPLGGGQGPQIAAASGQPGGIGFTPPSIPGLPAAKPAGTAPAAASWSSPGGGGATGTPHLGTGEAPGPGAGADATKAYANVAGAGDLGGFSKTLPGGALGGGSPLRQVWQNADGSAMSLDQVMGNLPEKLQPGNIAKQFGQIALGFVSGFFGIDTTYLGAASQIFDFASGKLGAGGAGADLSSATSDPAVQQALASGDTSGLPGGLLPKDATGSESGLQKDTVAIKRAIAAKFPQINTIGGFREDPSFPNEHPAGKAIDVMNGSDPKLGDQIKDYALTDPNVEYVIWNRKMWYPDGTSKAYTGDNPHTDHDHIHTTGGGYPDANTTYSLGTSLTPQTGPVGGSAGRSIGNQGTIKSSAYKAYLAAGMPPDEWDAFDKLIQNESSWDPTAQNPGSTAYGLGQFLDTTWATVGGTKSSDPMAQLPLIFEYLKSRPDYKGSPAAALALWNSREPHWYDQGGILKPGMTLARNDTGKNELVLTHEQASMLPHFAFGGDAARALRVPPPPLPRPPDVQRKIPAPIPMQPRPTTPAPAPAPTAPTPQPVATPPPSDVPPPPQSAESAPRPGAVTGPSGEAQKNEDTHLLPAIGKAIDSGAATIGAAANMAAAAATFGATGGLGGAIGGAGGGGGGLSIGGVIQQAGKIVKGVAEVGSSFLVGNVTGGTIEGDAYGETYKPTQKLPQTAPLNGESQGGRNYIFNGIDSRNVVDEMRLKDKQDAQAVLARW